MMVRPAIFGGVWFARIYLDPYIELGSTYRSNGEVTTSRGVLLGETARLIECLH